ncbi:KIRREL [Branchiostoma lanceolatum]|uniref:KIRREL protein n=1 Tax=Branchiostoma lanceolatum TaxID=7740 RepID=A0A8J9WC28_BRALA|nr:KIRREL [Branchiostoma lanceolatum]
MVSPQRAERIPLIALFFLCYVIKVQAVSYRERPESLAVREGQTVTLRCAFIGLTAQSVVIWEGPPNFNVMSTDRNVDSLYKRHRITGNSGRGEYSMEIKDVQVSDAGGYRCSTLGLQEKAEMMLDVIVPMKKAPKIIVSDISITAGQSLTLSCRTTEGSPLPTLTWFNGTTQVQQSNEELTDDRSIASLDLVLPELTRWDHGRNFTCVADQGHPELAPLTASSTMLNVKYSPVVRIRSQSIRASEGETLDLSCDVDSNPPATVTWRKLGGDIPTNAENRGGTLRLPTLDRTAAGVYQCQANNGIAPSGLGSATLTVQYPPHITSNFNRKTSPFVGQEAFSLLCEAEGYPEPRVRWRRKGTKLYFGKPYINTVSLKVSVRSGDTARLVCEILSDPLPEETRWLRRGPGQQDKPVTASQRPGIREEETTSPRGVTNTLVISHVGRSDGGVYVCETTNTFGTFQREFNMEVKDTNTQAVVIASITVIVLLILFATIFICIAKRTGLSAGVKREKATSSTLTASRALPPLPPYLNSRSVPAMDPDDMDGLELQDFNGTLKPRPPPRMDKQPYSIGLSYPSLMHPLPPYSTVERQRPDGEDNMVDSPYLEDPWETEDFMTPPALPPKDLPGKRIDSSVLC